MIHLTITEHDESITFADPVDGGDIGATRHGRSVLFNFGVGDDIVPIEMSVGAARELIDRLARWSDNVLTGDEQQTLGPF